MRYVRQCHDPIQKQNIHNAPKCHASESTMETESHFANLFFLYVFLFTDCLLDSVFDSSAGNCAVLYSKGDYTLVGLRIQRTVLWLGWFSASVASHMCHTIHMSLSEITQEVNLLREKTICTRRLHTAYADCILFIAYCILHIASCMLPIVYCQLLIA